MSIFDHLKKAAQGAAAEALRTGESRTFHFKALPESAAETDNRADSTRKRGRYRYFADSTLRRTPDTTPRRASSMMPTTVGLSSRYAEKRMRGSARQCRHTSDSLIPKRHNPQPRSGD